MEAGHPYQDRSCTDSCLQAVDHVLCNGAPLPTSQNMRGAAYPNTLDKPIAAQTLQPIRLPAASAAIL